MKSKILAACGYLGLVLLVLAAPGCRASSNDPAQPQTKLTGIQYEVTQKNGTERPFNWKPDNFTSGVKYLRVSPQG